MKLPHFLERIKSDLATGENLDAYVAIVLGAVLTALGVLGQLRQEWLNNFVLLTLTFLVLISLKNRYVMEDAQKLLAKVQQPDASDMLKDRAEYESLDARLSGAVEAIVIGQHLSGFIGFNRDAIRRYAKYGCSFKFLMADPVPLENRIRCVTCRSSGVMRRAGIR
jgi:hypothetical protein